MWFEGDTKKESHAEEREGNVVAVFVEVEASCPDQVGTYKNLFFPISLTIYLFRVLQEVFFLQLTAKLSKDF